MKRVTRASKQVRRGVSTQEFLVSSYSFKICEGGIGRWPTSRRSITGIASVQIYRQADLSQIIQARSSSCFAFGRAECRKQNCGKNCDDGDNHQQFKQGE